MKNIALIGLIALTPGFCFGACPQYDLTGDCWIGFDDFAALASEWLTGNREPVPYVLDMTQAEAERAIAAAGLTVGEVNFQYSETIAADNVISQYPTDDEFLAAEEPVGIVVSWGLNDLLPPDITWVYVNDSGAGMKDENGDPIDEGGFIGYMSKFETTNAQYCKYLNKAMTAGHIVVSGGGDYVRNYSGENYYDLAGLGYTYDGATNGGAAKINYNPLSHVFTVDSGFENYPVTYVTWYGAAAFADCYNWRLPTEWEWQAVADYDGSYEWACGPIIHNAMANYRGSYHPAGTITVGTLGTYGYGLCDMAGNVDEWTSSERLPGINFIRDGVWDNLAFHCRVSHRMYSVQSSSSQSMGFRVVFF